MEGAALALALALGWALVLAAREGVDGLDELSEDSDLGDPAKLLSPLQDFSDWWILHPKERTLCRLSHESGEAVQEAAATSTSKYEAPGIASTYLQHTGLASATPCFSSAIYINLH